MNTSETINEIAAALAKAQAGIQNPAKESENPHFKSRYADLSSGLNAVRPTLAANGIAIIQATGMEGDLMMLETRLVHVSGQWIGSIYPVCRFPTKQQEAGSALTYARRYALFALVGIAGEDDDGNEASKSDTPAPRQNAPKQMTPRAPVNDVAPQTAPAISEKDIANYKVAFTAALVTVDSMVSLGEFWDEQKANMKKLGVTTQSHELYKWALAEFTATKANLEQDEKSAA